MSSTAAYHRSSQLCTFVQICHIISTLTIAFTLLTLPAIAQSNLTFITTPTDAFQCIPLMLSWSGGSPPFSLAIVSSGIATPLQLYPDLSGLEFSWSSNISAGTTITFQLTDAEGDIAVSPAALTIQAGSNSCLPMSTSSTTQSVLSSHSHSHTLTSSNISTTASATASISESITKPLDLGPGPYSGIAIGGAFALAGAVLLLVMMRRRCRRKIVSRSPRGEFSNNCAEPVVDASSGLGRSGPQ